MTLIRDLVDIPEQIYQGDFVLKLSEGIGQDSTLQDYVVTTQLKAQFENALGFIQSAVENRQSKAAFIHGSFGSGKSHFMAILYMLLRGESAAWTHSELAPVAVKHSALRDSKFLLLDFHMIQAPSMEAAVLGGYVQKVRERHPKASIPAVYKSDHLLDDTRALLEEVGVANMVARLNQEGGSGEEGWGELAGGSWDEQRLRGALDAPQDNHDRRELVGLLLKTYFKSYAQQKSDVTEAYVPFEEGLLRLTQHAQGLGYNAIVLFLDELVLWLASKAADLKFVHDEIQKVVKLIESGNAKRPIPIISLVARQRDLRELIGEGASGFDQFNFQDAVKHWQGRFHLIELEDSNLPEIVARRILKPRNESARIQLEEAFERLKLSKDVRETLQTGHYDLEAFRKVYPFSPALIDTLVAISSLLQRNRTAIRILFELLVEQRDTLELGKLIPVGDLYDFVSRQFEPYTPAMRQSYESAQRLLQERFLPFIYESHQLKMGDPPTPALETDVRLAKTLLLSALVPSVEALRELTAQKLAALNHGTIKSPIPGQEAGTVLRKLQKWQTQIGELRVDEETKRVSLNLTAVDIDRILEQVRNEDNYGNQKRLLRKMLYEALGFKENAQAELTLEYPLLWRGTVRPFEIHYLNVRKKAVSELRAYSLPRLILDYPFDEEDGSSRDDLIRLDEYRKTIKEDTRTTVWLPRFLSRRSLRDLGRLIQIEHVLTGERFLDYAQHLSANDRPQAKQLLENQRSALRERVRQALEMAYGVRTPEPGVLDEGDQQQLRPEDMFQSLHTAFQPRIPSAADLQGALKELLSQELAAHFPAHPEFTGDREITVAQVKQVWKELQRAVNAPTHRIEIEKSLRDRLVQIVTPMLLADMGETHLVLKLEWLERLQRAYHRDGDPEPLTVRHLHRWIDQPKVWGLPNRLRNLIVHVFAELTQRSLLRQGTPVLDFEAELDPETILRQQELPTEEEWQAALSRVRLLSEQGPLQRSVPNLRVLESRFVDQLKTLGPTLIELQQLLAELAGELGEATEDLSRLQTARLARNWLETAEHNYTTLERLKRIAGLGQGDVPALLQAHFHSCQITLKALKQGHVAPLKTVINLTQNGHASGQELVQPLREALREEEQGRPLAPALQHFVKYAPEWVSRTLKKPPSPPPPSPPPVTPPQPPSLHTRAFTGISNAEARTRVKELLELLESHGNSKVNLSWALLE